MSQAITQDDLFKILRGYETRMDRIETALRQIPAGKMYGGEIHCTNPPTLGSGVLNVSAVARSGLGIFQLTHTATTIDTKLWVAACSAADTGGANAPHTAIWRPVDATHSTIIVYDRAGNLLDGETVYFIGYG